VFRQKLYRKSKHILCSISCFRKSCILWDNVDILYSRTGHRWKYGACAL